MEKILIDLAKALFSAGVEFYKSRGDDEETAREKAAAMLQDAPRAVDLDTEALEEIANR